MKEAERLQSAQSHSFYRLHIPARGNGSFSHSCHPHANGRTQPFPGGQGRGGQGKVVAEGSMTWHPGRFSGLPNDAAVLFNRWSLVEEKEAMGVGGITMGHDAVMRRLSSRKSCGVFNCSVQLCDDRRWTPSLCEPVISLLGHR